MPTKGANRFLNKKLIITVVLIVVGLVVGFMVYKSSKSYPLEDKKKVYDLYKIDDAIQRYYHKDPQFSQLPNSLSDLGALTLRGNLNNYTYSKDPNGQAGQFGYTLCTTFVKKGEGLNPYGYTDYAKHTAGKNCFSHDIYGDSITKGKYGNGMYPDELKAWE